MQQSCFFAGRIFWYDIDPLLAGLAEDLLCEIMVNLLTEGQTVTIMRKKLETND